MHPATNVELSIMQSHSTEPQAAELPESLLHTASVIPDMNYLMTEDSNQNLLEPTQFRSHFVDCMEMSADMAYGGCVFRCSFSLVSQLCPANVGRAARRQMAMPWSLVALVPMAIRLSPRLGYTCCRKSKAYIALRRSPSLAMSPWGMTLTFGRR